jgi:heme exporter protein A
LLYGDLTPDENLNFFARMYDLHTDDGISVAERIDTALTQVGLVARRRDPVRTFSRGMIQRLAIARAMLHEPDIMLLDEPYTGLDLQAADMLRAVLQELAASKGASSSASGAPTEYACRRTIILTTHNLEQGLEMCDRAAIINRGKVVWQAPRAGLDLESMKEIYRTVTRQKPTRQAPGANRRGASTG